MKSFSLSPPASQRRDSNEVTNPAKKTNVNTYSNMLIDDVEYVNPMLFCFLCLSAQTK
jgi:hypothetical protein